MNTRFPFITRRGLVNICRSLENIFEKYSNVSLAYSLGDPACESNIKNAELILRKKIPPRFKRILTEVASSFEFKWIWSPSETDCEDEGFSFVGSNEPIFMGELTWSLEKLLELNCDSTRSASEYMKEFRINNSLAFHKMVNGDLFAVYDSGPKIDAIIYLSHDLDPIHGSFLSLNIDDFIYHYEKLFFTGPDYHAWELFLNKKTLYMDSESEHAINFIHAVKNGY